jgi:small-conductance mechanosensitive channel
VTASYLDWLQSIPWMQHDQQRRLLVSLAIVAALVLARWLVMRVVGQRTDDVRIQYQWKKASAYVAFLLGALLVGRVWFEGVSSLATYLGLLSAGVAIALRDPLVNLAAWAFLLWRRPFEVGDRIQIGDNAGDVIDMRIFQFSLNEIGNWVAADQSTGRIIHVPNGLVFTEAVANYTRGFEFIWNELPVMVTFESDWRAAKRVLEEVLDRHALHLAGTAEAQVRKAARQFMIFYGKLTPVVYTSVADSGVVLTMRYLCGPRQRRGTAQVIWEDVLTEFAKTDAIDFAYPTQRFYDNRREGKPGAGGLPPAPGDGGP